MYGKDVNATFAHEQKKAQDCWLLQRALAYLYLNVCSFVVV